MKFPLVIFDFDGTLADTLAWFVDISDRVADEFGVMRLDRCKLSTLRGYDARTILRMHRVPLWKLPRIARRFHALMSEQIHQIRPFAGITDLLGRLSHAGHTVAVVTSNTWDNVRTVLGQGGAGAISHHETGVALFGKRAKLRKILRRTGARPEHTIFIGDEIRDAEAARQAGVAFGAVSWGYTHVTALRALSPSPDEVFASVEEIAAKVAGG